MWWTDLSKYLLPLKEMIPGTATQRIALTVIVLLQPLYVLCWDHCAQWLPRPPEGYVWEHDLKYWAAFSECQRNPRQLEYGPVNINNKYEEWQWIWVGKACPGGSE